MTEKQGENSRRPKKPLSRKDRKRHRELRRNQGVHGKRSDDSSSESTGLSYFYEVLKKTVGLGKSVYRRLSGPVDGDVGNYVEVTDSGVRLVDEEDVPEKHRDTPVERSDRVISRTGRSVREFRGTVLKGLSESQIADKAANNPYVMGDVLDSPDLVGADTDLEAVAQVAEANPGWAKMSSVVEAYDLDVDAESGEVSMDGDSDPSGTGSSGEAGSNGGSGDTGFSGVEGGVTTDVSEYGLDTGTASTDGTGSSGSGDSGGSGAGGSGASGSSAGGTGVGGDAL